MSTENENELQPDPQESLPNFQPVELSDQELDDIGYELRTGDPARVAAAKSRLAAAEYGGDAEAVREALRTSVEVKAALSARAAGENFAASNPEYKQCSQNAKAIVAYLQANKMGPTAKNMQIAFNRLKAEGKLLLNEEETEPQPIETAHGKIDGGILALPDAEFVQAVDRLPSEKYRQLFLNSPAFVERINRLGGGDR